MNVLCCLVKFDSLITTSIASLSSFLIALFIFKMGERKERKLNLKNNSDKTQVDIYELCSKLSILSYHIEDNSLQAMVWDKIRKSKNDDNAMKTFWEYNKKVDELIFEFNITKGMLYSKIYSIFKYNVPHKEEIKLLIKNVDNSELRQFIGYFDNISIEDVNEKYNIEKKNIKEYINKEGIGKYLDKIASLTNHWAQ
jgi:hypothetical protein